MTYFRPSEDRLMYLDSFCEKYFCLNVEMLYLNVCCFFLLLLMIIVVINTLVLLCLKDFMPQSY